MKNGTGLFSSSLFLPLIILLSCIPLFLLITGCSKGREGGETQTLLGLIVTRTEGNHENAKIMEEIGKWAVEEANERFRKTWKEGPIRITLAVEDDKNQQDAAVSAVRQLITGKRVAAIVGPQFSNSAIPAARVAEKAKVPLISPMSTNPETTLGKKFAFRSVFVDSAQGKAMADFAVNALGAKSAAVLYDVSNEYNRGLAKMFIRAFSDGGGEISAEETYTSDTSKDFSPQLTVIKEAAPDVLYLPNYENDSYLQAVQAEELGISSILLGGDGWNPQRFAPEAIFRGSYMTHHWSPELQGEKVEAFVKAYLQRYKKDPKDIAATTYDAFGLIFKAIEETQSVEPEEIARGLRNLTYEGVTGEITFGETGDPKKGVIISRWEQGSYTFQTIVYPE